MRSFYDWTQGHFWVIIRSKRRPNLESTSCLPSKGSNLIPHLTTLHYRSGYRTPRLVALQFIERSIGRANLPLFHIYFPLFTPRFNQFPLFLLLHDITSGLWPIILAVTDIIKMKYSIFFLTFDMYIDSELPLLYDLDLKFSAVSEKKNTKAK